jgi:hypothetical protein
MALRRISDPVTFERETRARDERLASLELETMGRKEVRRRQVAKLKAAYRNVMETMPMGRERKNYQFALLSMLGRYGASPDD